MRTPILERDPPQVPMAIPWPGGPVELCCMCNVPGERCRFCGEGNRAGIGLWEVRRGGKMIEVLVVCYMCAAEITATMLGWDEGGDWLEPLRAARDGDGVIAARSHVPT